MLLLDMPCKDQILIYSKRQYLRLLEKYLLSFLAIGKKNFQPEIKVMGEKYI